MAKAAARHKDASCPLEQQLDALARRIVDLRFDSAALFFLEAHLPFTAVFHTAGLFFEPIATPLFGAERIHTLKSLLSDRRNVERADALRRAFHQAS